MQPLINKIKEKRELSDLPDELVRDVLTKYLKKHNIKIPSSKKLQKTLIKSIRAELRKYAGMFQISSKKRIKLLEKNQTSQLLKTHASTKERLFYYPKLIKIIKKLSPKSIIDLGCGLNPIAIAAKLNNKETTYYAIDIKGDELLLIKEFFKKNKIRGKTRLADIRKINKFPKTDLALILKTLDIIDDKKHSISRNIIKNLNSKNIITSFSTRTLSGKPMNSPRRQWFENILKDLNYRYKMTKTNNEVFYVIEKP